MRPVRGQEIEHLVGVVDREVADLPGPRAAEAGRGRVADDRRHVGIDEDVEPAEMAGPEGVVAEDHLVGHQRVLADVAADLGQLDHAVQHGVVAPGVRLLLQPVDQLAEFGGLAQHVLGRQHPELDLVDRQQVLDVVDLGDGILDLAVDHILDGQRVDGALVLGHELVHQLRGVGEGGVHDRQVDLRRRQDDEAAVDLIGVEIIVVAAFLGDFRREAGAVDLEALQLGRLAGRRRQAPCCSAG